MEDSVAFQFLPLSRNCGKGDQDGDDVAPFHNVTNIAKPFLLFHFLLFNCYVPDDESTLTIALLKVEGGWHGVERFEGEGEVGVE